MDKKKLLPVIIVLTTFFSAISAFAQVASVKGVVVVCPGGEEPVVQQRIISAVTTALDISSKRVFVTRLA